MFKYGFLKMTVCKSRLSRTRKKWGKDVWPMEHWGYGPTTLYGRIISCMHASCSRMWQCQTYPGPSVASNTFWETSIANEIGGEKARQVESPSTIPSFLGCSTLFFYLKRCRAHSLCKARVEHDIGYPNR